MDKVIPVKVAVRVRPLNEKETSEGCQTALEQVEGEPQVITSCQSTFCIGCSDHQSIAFADVSKPRPVLLIV